MWANIGSARPHTPGRDNVLEILPLLTRDSALLPHSLRNCPVQIGLLLLDCPGATFRRYSQYLDKPAHSRRIRHDTTSALLYRTVFDVCLSALSNWRLSPELPTSPRLVVLLPA